MLCLEKPQGFIPDIEAVGCFVAVNGKILLLKKLDSHPLYPGLWGLPGGKIKKGETPLVAMIREIGEETGIVVGNGDLGFLGKSYITYPSLKFVYYLFSLFLGSDEEGLEIHLDAKEHQKHGLFLTADIFSKGNMMPDTDSCLRHFYS